VNRAGTEALEGLPGIGPALARRVVAHRDSAGPFRTADDLLAVRGIGPATLERLRDRIRFR
jgi:competence protein ComEA